MTEGVHFWAMWGSVGTLGMSAAYLLWDLRRTHADAQRARTLHAIDADAHDGHALPTEEPDQPTEALVEQVTPADAGRWRMELVLDADREMIDPQRRPRDRWRERVRGSTGRPASRTDSTGKDNP
jgi:hypothetical protein